MKIGYLLKWHTKTQIIKKIDKFYFIKYLYVQLNISQKSKTQIIYLQCTYPIKNYDLEYIGKMVHIY